MNILRQLIAAITVTLLAQAVLAHEYYVAGFTLIHPWAEPTPPDATTAAVYFHVEQIAVNDRLVSAQTPYAGSVEFRAAARHGNPADDDGQAPLAALALVAGQEMAFVPGQAHLLLRDLKAPLQWGRSYAMTLVFERAGEVQVMVSVGAH
jgi:copper(I)-binding protein